MLQSTSQFSKKCSERWKTVSAKEKGKFEDLGKLDKARYEREMKTYIPPKGKQTGSSRIPMHPRGLLRPSSCSVLSIAPTSRENTLAYPLVMLQRNGKKSKKGIAAYRAKGKPDAARKGAVKAEESKKKKEEEEEEEDEEDDEDE
ncbi:Hypothetical predicted protein [Marmota monax]|uniref:HMG box domain-containing protein n=1 Tax=Marmota monax TaxID=9995 RepID=A0A5E4A378_MARMO|nr:Hypothetical predicted protein [Marmota monax]